MALIGLDRDDIGALQQLQARELARLSLKTSETAVYLGKTGKGIPMYIIFTFNPYSEHKLASKFRVAHLDGFRIKDGIADVIKVSQWRDRGSSDTDKPVSILICPAIVTSSNFVHLSAKGSSSVYVAPSMPDDTFGLILHKSYFDGDAIVDKPARCYTLVISDPNIPFERHLPSGIVIRGNTNGKYEG